MTGRCPRITFGVIVLNGEPFTRYCLRSLYPFAHQIVVVEGASRLAAAFATPDGHSTDGTLDALRRFKAEEDPEDKLEIITREGFWEEKDEQSRAYAGRATGDWLWQVDIDEFYRPEDVRRVLDLLGAEPGIAGLSFMTLTFWCAPDYRVDGPHLRTGHEEVPRVFRFQPGYTYARHRPPTVLDERGRDLRELKWLNGRTMARRGVYMYHYPLLFPKQVTEKCAYYGEVLGDRYPEMAAWAEKCYLRLGRPFRVHNAYLLPSWLEPYRGAHPPEVIRMMEDARAGRLDVELRRTDDVEALLRSPAYALGRAALKLWTGLRYGGLGSLARRLLEGPRRAKGAAP